MSTVDFNSLIYTASKSLKKSDVRATQEVHDINHILQDKVLTAVRNKEAFKQEMSIKAWFFQVMAKTFQPHPEISIAKGTSKANEPTHTIASTQETDQLHVAMSKLENDLLVPFMMHFQGFKMEEIASNLNLPVEKVISRVGAAREFLVNQMPNL